MLRAIFGWERGAVVSTNTSLQLVGLYATQTCLMKQTLYHQTEYSHFFKIAQVIFGWDLTIKGLIVFWAMGDSSEFKKYLELKIAFPIIAFGTLLITMPIAFG